MLPGQREALILDLLQQRGVVSVEDICVRCHCSAVTARRDLRRMEDEGKLSRTHGGAVPLPTAPPTQPVPNGGPGLLETRTVLTDRSDVLVVTPNDTAVTRLLVERARRAGAPIIAEASHYQGALTVVAVDNYQAGLEAGRCVAQYARQNLAGRVAALDVTYPVPNTEARSRGFADGLAELPPGQRSLFRVNGQGLRETARQIVADALAVHPEINVIFGVNDDSALGALDAYRAAGLDERRLLVVPFGLEGGAARELLLADGPCRIGVAMFPELVGRACIDAAVCAYHGCSLPERVVTPFAVVTGEALERFYQRDPDSGGWQVNWELAAQLPTASAGFARLGRCGQPSRPARIGYVHIFSSHAWYQNVRRAMQAHAETLGMTLEVVDASRDMAHEIDMMKQAIGRAAARFVREGDTVILDGGVTTTYLARALRGRQGITVITNSLPVLAELGQEPGLTLVSTGGVVRQQGQSLTGPGAEASLQELRADKAFISATGLSLNFGLSNTNISEAGVKQAILRAAREVILLADHTKIGAESLVKVAPVESIHHLVTDAGISAHDRQALTYRGIEVTIADEGA